jgi:hypothetical protein
MGSGDNIAMTGARPQRGQASISEDKAEALRKAGAAEFQRLVRAAAKRTSAGSGADEPCPSTERFLYRKCADTDAG